MVGRRRTAAHSSRGRRAANNGDTGPGIYQDMLAEAGVHLQPRNSPERPLKRRRPNAEERPDASKEQRPPAEDNNGGNSLQNNDVASDNDEDEDDDVEFQDVELPAPTFQTMELDSDEDEDESEDEGGVKFEDVELTMQSKDDKAGDTKPQNLELNLSALQAAASPRRRAGERRRPITKEEREHRVEIHKMHLLCLLAHVSRRNRWCNDRTAQDYLRPHMTDKTVKYLNPSTNLSQFGRTESLKNGLKTIMDMWRTKFEITERGLRRSLWAEEVEDLKEYELSVDAESCLDRDDFREAANKLQGSRDVGAQLFCALLRSAGVRARLVCSLQPLTFLTGGPVLPKPSSKTPTHNNAKNAKVRASMANYEKMADAARATTAGGSTARRRLGHPNATAYNFEPATTSPVKKPPTFHAPIKIKESAYPVYWVEILDVGHQKWQPVDPVVTHTSWKPKVFEPAITDRENCMSYVIAFDADGTAKDVTRRYAKAYAAKTRKLRIEIAAVDGEKWFRKALKLYRSPLPTDLDQIEDNELMGVEAREPMPRNVQDFKDHPVYALERHLRRNEVLLPEATPSGTVAAGSRGPLEKIYRRKDVRIARTIDKWYRMGREVKPLEIPVKWLPKKKKPARDLRFDDEEDDDDNSGGLNGMPIYTLEQTDEYEPPPVRNGRVPKNKFGNIDVYVPSMVPKGGIHVVHEHAVRAAYLLGIDYAPALTGFNFKGRHGTAVLTGIVVAEEFGDAVRAILEGLGDLQQEMEDERRRVAVLRMWRRLLMGLRIRERVWKGVDEEERREAEKEADMNVDVDVDADADADADVGDAASDVTEEFDMVDDDDEGGGFVVDDDEEEGGGGFVVE